MAPHTITHCSYRPTRGRVTRVILHIEY